MSEDLLTQERRARMAAERLLDQKQAELNEANRQLSRHAIALSEDLVETRGVVEEVRTDLERATQEVTIAKRRLWDSIEAISDGFAVFDENERLVIANSAWLAPFDGLEHITVGAHYDEVIDAALSEGVIDIGGLSAEGWRRMMRDRWAQSQPDPTVLRLWNGTYLRMIDQRAPGGDTVSLALNITEEIEREKILREARNRAEAASRAKSAFLANMSHEIRTPMNGVVAMADLLGESPLDDEQKLYVDTIRSSGTALLTIINDVLDYSKIEATKLVLKPIPFDLEKTLLDVVMLLQPSIREKGLKIMVDYDMFLPTRFLGDAVRIRQVLTNLIGNAVKFTAEGHVLIRVVGLPVEPGPAQRVHLTVEDTGIGIPSDKLGAIFGEFNQVEDDRNRSFEGTGLGLAISKRLVELMGGAIWVESEAGLGSCFGVQMTLPVVPDAEVPGAPDWIRSALLVMADDLHRTILMKRLTAIGVRPVIADSAQDALDLPLADVLFCDDAPPGMALDKFLTAFGDLSSAPVVLLAPTLGPTPATGEAGPVAGVLQKPLSRLDLLDLLNKLPVAREHAAPPLPASDPPDAGTAPESDTTTPPLQPDLRRMRVLAAEDNKTNRLVFSKLVKTCDIDLTFAENGAEAVAAYEATRPDLVFMDISMPGMDGKEATRHIRMQEARDGWPRCRIVALTAHAMAEDGEEIFANGLDRHLTKPLKKKEIFDELASACPQDACPPLPKGSALSA